MGKSSVPRRQWQRRERRVEIESGKRKDARDKISELRKSLDQDGPIALEKYNATFGELAAEYQNTRYSRP